MNRRHAIKLTSALSLSPLLAGCPASTVEGEINVVLEEAVNVLSVIEPNASWLPDLQAAVNALQRAEASWQSGGAVQGVINTLNAILAVTSVIPLDEKYSALIDVLVAGIEAVLVALPASTTHTFYIIPLPSNPHIGRTTIPHHFMRSHAYDFKQAWNKAAVERGLIVAVIE